MIYGLFIFFLLFMHKTTLFRRCAITGSFFCISHLIFGPIVYFFIIGISTKATLALFCAFIFIIISIVFFIIGCQQFCSLQENQVPYLISTGVLSLFASISCFYINTNWLASKNIVNRIPFYLLIIASLYLTFTCTLVAFFNFLNSNDVSPLFQIHGTVLGKFVCDLLTSLILSFIFSFTYSDSTKHTNLTAFILFSTLPCSFYTMIGCLLECYSQNIYEIIEPSAQM